MKHFLYVALALLALAGTVLWRAPKPQAPAPTAPTRRPAAPPAVQAVEPPPPDPAARAGRPPSGRAIESLARIRNAAGEGNREIDGALQVLAAVREAL